MLGYREAAEFKKQCEEEPEKMQFQVSARGNNTGVLRRCIRETRDAVEFLRDRDNDVEEWQVAGIAADIAICEDDELIPVDYGRLTERAEQVAKNELESHIRKNAEERNKSIDAWLLE